MERYEPCARLFSTPFWHYSTSPPEYAVEWALDYEKRNPVSAKISNIGGYQSETSENFLEIPFFETIRDGLQDLPEFIFLNWWLNINRKGDYNVTHTHPSSYLSGVYSITGNHGSLILINPLSHTRDIFETHFGWNDCEQTNSNTYRVKAMPGDITIFPSDVPHRVNPNMGDTPRISLSFNIGFNDGGMLQKY